MAAVNLLPHCSICKRSLRYGGFEPFLLPCLHTVCSDCMNSACVTISCCHCRESYCKRDHIFLKDSITAAAILASTAKNNPSKIKCTNKTHDVPAEIWCRDCQVFYCKKCQSSHSQIRASHSHDQILVKDLGTGTPQKLTSRCPQHEQYPLNLYDVTCEILICSRCTKSDHKQCECEDIEGPSFEEAKNVLKQDHQAVDKQLQRVVTSLEEIAREKIQINTRKDTMRKKLTSQFDAIRGLINEREKQLNNALESMDTFALGECENVTTVLDNLAERLQSVCDYTKLLSAHCDGGDLLLLQSTVTSRVKSCLKENMPEIDTPSLTISFKEHIAQITTLLSQLGSIEAEGNGSSQYKSINYENVDIQNQPDSNTAPCGEYVDMSKSVHEKPVGVKPTSEGAVERRASLGNLADQGRACSSTVVNVGSETDVTAESSKDTSKLDSSSQPMTLL